MSPVQGRLLLEDSASALPCLPCLPCLRAPTPMKFVRPSDLGGMERLLGRLESSAPTYAEVGATLAGQDVAGFTHLHDETVLGSGAPTFTRAVEGLRHWKAHGLRGLAVFPEDATIRSGATVIVTMGTPLLALAAPCRIVGMVEDADRWGFAYGTLPGHPEQGEEAFEVTMAKDGSVRFAITAFSRPGDPLVRLSGPLGRRVQVLTTKAYLGALHRFVDREGS